MACCDENMFCKLYFVEFREMFFSHVLMCKQITLYLAVGRGLRNNIELSKLFTDDLANCFELTFNVL